MDYPFKSSYPDDSDFQLEYNKLIEFRKINKLVKKRGNGIHEHHIIPRCFFTDDQLDEQEHKDNKINLRPHEHFMAHYFLFELYKDHKCIYICLIL